MKKAFKKSVSLLLCLTLLATAFCIPGLISSASEGWSSIRSYDELSGIYDDFVYIGTEVYETDYEGNNPVLTDYRVKAGDWLEVRTYIKSDHYIGDTSIVSLFSNDFFDVKDPNGTMSGSNEYYSGELYTVNDMHHVVESRDIRAQVNAKPVSEFTALTKTSNIEYPEMYDAVMVDTLHGTSDNNPAGDYVSDYWVYSYKVQVKYDLADGMTGSISSPLELWQSAINESTGQYDRRKRSYVYLSPEKIGYETDEVLYSQCDIMADIMNSVCEMNVIIDDMNHEFIIGNDRYNLTLDANGGCFDEGQAVFYCDFEAGEELHYLPCPQRPGYMFMGWADNNYGDLIGYPSVMPENDLNLYAVWERCEYTITFDANGGLFSYAGDTLIYDIYYGAETEPPADPVKDGFTFMGWFDEEGNLMEFPFVAERDITFHAYWEANEYNIVFHADGGEFISGEHEIETTLRYGEEIRRPDYPCKEGYYFLGWSTDPGSPYLVEIPETMPAHDLVLYAVWQVGEFTLSFDDGFGNVFLSLNMDYGEDMGFVEYISCPKQDGLVFRYWADSETGEELIFPSFMPSHDITLVAVWDYSDFTVTFDYNGGYDSWGNPAIDMIFRTGDLVDCEIPFREGYTFAGWEDRHGNRVDTPLIMPEEDITLYAVWELNRYRITFTDGFGWVMFEEEYYYGEAIDFREAPEKEGYTFAGWYSDYGYDCPPVMPAHDIVLHASWVVNEFRIRWIADGVYDEETVYEYGQEIIPPANPEKEGYVFAGWDSSVPQTMPAENLVFTAIWEQARPVIYRTETYTMNTAGTYDKSVVSHSMEKSGEVSAEPVIPEGFELNEKKSVLTGYAHTDEELVLKIYIDRQSFCFTKTINGSSVSVEYYYGSVINEPVTPELSGHLFTGWEPQVPHTMPAHDVTVTATFRKMTDDEAENAEITFYITSLKNVTLNYGESITLRAYTKNLPAGSEVRWSVDTKAVTISPSADGRLCTVTAVSSGGAAITARVVDGNGRTVSDKNGNELKDTETVYSEYNTWLMILNFFRKLFNFSF